MRPPSGAWNLWRCHRCAAYPVEECVACPPVSYEAEYFERTRPTESATYSGYLSYEDDEALMRQDFRERLRPWIHPGMRVLDVGCATGVGLLAARDCGVDESSLIGIDCSRYASAKARERLPAARIVTGNIERVVLGKGYDFIILWDMLEHVPSPTALMSRLVGALNHGGKISIYTPNPESLARKLAGSHWTEFRPGEHRCFVGRNWCEIRAREHGLRILEMRSVGKRVTLEHATSRLRAYLPWIPHLMSRTAMKINLGDHLLVVLERV